MTPIVCALVALLVVVFAALLNCVFAMNRAEERAEVVRGTTDPRAAFIARLRSVDAVVTQDYASVLELSEPEPGETAATLAEGYRDFLAKLPSHHR